MQVITFRLAAPLKLPNRRSAAAHWGQAAGDKAKERRALALEIMSQVVPRPAVPFKFCTVQVWRFGIQEPDYDGLVSSTKRLLDVLQPLSPRCPDGLGIVENDKPTRLFLRVIPVRAKRRSDQCTRVLIREITQAELDAMRAAEVAEAA